MKNIFLRVVASFAGLASDDSNMSTCSSHPCFTTRVIYEHETRGCEVMFTMVYILAKYHPLRLTHATYRFLLHIFVQNCLVIHLSPKTKLRQEHLYSYRLVRNFVHIDAYQCKTLLILVELSNTKHFLCIHHDPTDRKCCQNNTSEMFWHFPEYRPLDRQCEIVRGKVIRDFVGHVKILSGHVKFWNYVPDGHVLPGTYSGVPNSQTRLIIYAVRKRCRVFFYLLWCLFCNICNVFQCVSNNNAVFQITASPSARSRQLWRRTGNFLKTFLQFYVYDLRFKAAGLATFLVEFWTLNNVIKYCGWGIPHNWDMSFGNFGGLPTLVAFPEN